MLAGEQCWLSTMSSSKACRQVRNQQAQHVSSGLHAHASTQVQAAVPKGAGSSRSLTSQEARHEEVEQAPQLQRTVLDGCAAQHQPVLRLQPLHSLQTRHTAHTNTPEAQSLYAAETAHPCTSDSAPNRHSLTCQPDCEHACVENMYGPVAHGASVLPAHCHHAVTVLLAITPVPACSWCCG